jgi:transcriptional repressor NrdR
VKCPFCAVDDDRVVDSRTAEDGVAIRRRRECAACGQRFTTFERIEEAALMIVKRSGEREPFDREKVIRGVVAACKNRPVDEEAIVALASRVEEQMRDRGGDVPTEEVGLAILESLRELDQVAYVRFASVYKGFEGADDFEREIKMLEKTTAPKSKG